MLPIGFPLTITERIGHIGRPCIVHMLPMLNQLAVIGSFCTRTMKQMHDIRCTAGDATQVSHIPRDGYMVVLCRIEVEVEFRTTSIDAHVIILQAGHVQCRTRLEAIVQSETVYVISVPSVGIAVYGEYQLTPFIPVPRMQPLNHCVIAHCIQPCRQISLVETLTHKLCPCGIFGQLTPYHLALHKKRQSQGHPNSQLHFLCLSMSML